VRKYLTLLDKTRLLIFSVPLILLSAQYKANAYPQVEMQACVNNAITAVAQKGISATLKQVKQYCDCSLRKIMDEGKDINASVSYCNNKYINR